MTAATVRIQLNAERFRPFHVKTTDGDTFSVSHPDFAIIGGEGTDVTIYDADGHYRVIAIPHIVSLEPIREQTRKPGKR